MGRIIQHYIHVRVVSLGEKKIHLNDDQKF